MKKAVAIMTAAMMVMSLAACGGSDQAAATTAAPAAESKAETPAADSQGFSFYLFLLDFLTY